MNRISVVIPSRNDDNLLACLSAVLSKEGRHARTIAVDDGLAAETRGEDVRLRGERPFVFARNCNIGIRWAAHDDIVLLNDDALLETAEGFRHLQYAAAERPEVGLVGAVTNLTGNPGQWQVGDGAVRIEHRAVCFVCVFIPRRTFERVGLLDERFVPYGWEDNDFCRRVQNAGLQLAIHDGVFVDHGSLTSTFRGAPSAVGDIGPGHRIYTEKWGA